MMMEFAYRGKLRYVGGLLAALLSGCATTPPALQGSFPTLTPQQTLTQAAPGSTVRWGGEIITTRPGKDETCFEILARPLDATARPVLGDAVQHGRFIGCARSFYDPEEYAKGRELTVTGRLQSPVQGKIGEYDYRYPRVQIDTLHLWPLRVRGYDAPPYYYRDPFYDPFYDPFWPFGHPRRWR